MRRRNPLLDDECQDRQKTKIPDYNPEMSVLDCFDVIASHAEDCALKPEFLVAFQPFLERVANTFSITPMQVLLLCAFMDRCSTCLGMRDLQRYFSACPIAVMRVWSEVEDLSAKGFLEWERGQFQKSTAEYSITDDAMTAIRHSMPLVVKEAKQLTATQFVSEMRMIICKKRRSSMMDEDFVNRVLYLNKNNMHLDIAREVMNAPLDDQDKAILSFMLNRYLLSNGSTCDIENITDVFDDDAYGLRMTFQSGQEELITKNYIMYANSDGMAKKDVFDLTDSTREKFLHDYTLTDTCFSDITGLIETDSIVSKDMFYSPEDDKQISSLSSLLDDSHLQDIRKRLEEAKMRKGFCCLFYGAPGTGKTETALQLARQTGRAIMQVNLSQARDMWYGQTEKNVKRIFTDYRRLAEKSKLLPILLFNEADAILSVRQTLMNSRSTDKTENAIQNIILQEMETFEGIMIATTNLTQNLDKAFERRFLYKVEFHRPTLEAKQQIWHAMLPDVAEEVTRQLAQDYDLTGGQIENVARKYMVNHILYGDEHSALENLTEFCHQEAMNNHQSSHIGFH